MKYFFLFLLSLFPLIGLSQSVDIKFDGSINNFDLSKKEAGVTIAIVQNGATVSSATSATNGKYSLRGKVDSNIPFDVVFTKSGMVSKRINFNLKGINLEDSPAGDLKPIEALDIELFGERPGVDFSFLSTQPVGKFSWNAQGYAALDQAGMKVMTDKINKLLKDSELKDQQNDLAYNQSIQAADKAYIAKNYEAAMAKYEEANQLKPKEQHPINRINELDGILQKQREANLQNQQDNAAYTNLITAADNFFKAGDYEKAKAKYYEASDISDNQYPLDQVKEIARLLKEKENEVKYKQMIDAADMMVKQKSFKSARDNYFEASKLKPNEQYPKDKMKELDDKIKGESDALAKKQQYEILVTQAEALMKTEKWEEAKVKFEEALKLESASTYVTGQIEIIKKKLADLLLEKEKAEKITKLLNEGNQAFVAKTYEPALLKFKEVIGLDPQNATASNKIEEINGILDAELKSKELTDKFNALVKQGDDANTAKKYADALTKYNEAKALKEDTALEIKIQEVTKKLEDLKNAAELEANFTKLMSEGAVALTAKDYPTALLKYEAAQVLKTDDQTVVTKISEVKKLIGEQQSLADKQSKIAKLLQEGTELLEGGVMDGVQLEPAKAKFKEVIDIDPTNATAMAKIIEIDGKLLAAKDLADKEAKFNENVAKGNADFALSEWTKAIGFYNVALSIKEDPAVRQKLAEAQGKIDETAAAKQLDIYYQKAMADATAFKVAKKYTEAIAKFEQAKNLKQTEKAPQDEIDAINLIIAEQGLAAEKTKQIAALVQEGESAFVAKDFITSKGKYNQVIELDPNNAAATKRLVDIELELKKLAGEAEKNQQIATLIQQGEQLFNAAQYENAEAPFKQIQILDPSNATASKYIADIATKLAEKKQAADLELKFTTFVTQGDNAVSTSKYEVAVTAYTQALALKNGDAQVSQKLAAAQAKIGELSAEQTLNNNYLVAISAANALRDQGKYTEAIAKYTEAKAIKPLETVPQQEIDKINALILKDQKAKQIDDLLAEGNQLLTAKDYTNAKSKFNQVIDIDNTNAVAIAKIAEITKELDAMNANLATEEAFKTFKADGLTAYSIQDYNNAMINFKRALELKKDAEIDTKIAEILSLRSEQSQKQTQITNLLASGKTAMDAKNWQDAASKYNEVLDLDPQNSTATSQMLVIETELSKAKNEAQLTAEFNSLKQKGYAEANADDLLAAKATLEQALKLKKDTEITQKLSEIDNQITNKAQAEKLETDFKAAIQAAENYESASDLENALKKYKEALLFKGSSQLAKDKIDAISKEIAANNLASNLDKSYTDALQQGDALMSALDYNGAIAKYKEAKNAKPSEETPTIKISLAEKALEASKKNADNVAFEKLIQDITLKIEENNFGKAKELLTTAVTMQPTDPRITALASKLEQLDQEQKAYAEFMSKGAKEEIAKNYQEALAFYEKAQLAQPNSNEPTVKIAAIRKLLDQANSEATKASIYQQYFDAGLANQSSKEYELALNNYKNALNAKQNDAAALAKITEVETAISNQLLQNKAKNDADQAFNKIVLEADEYFNANNFQKAAETYRLALTSRPDHAYSKRQLNESERLNKQESINLLNQQYQKILDVADNNFRSKNYDKALEYYRRALSIKNNDSYPMKRIDEINGILNPVAEESGELKPLGDPFDGSILDGETALLQAEAQRKDAKRNKLKNTEEKSLLTNSQLLGNKNEEMTQTINSIYSLYTKIIEDQKDQAVDKLAISQNVTTVESLKTEMDVANSTYQQQAAYQTQEQLNSQSNQMNIDYNSNIETKKEAHVNVDKVRTNEENLTNSKLSNNHNENIITDEKITSVQKQVASDTETSNAQQVEIALTVDQRRVETENQHSTIDLAKYNSTLSNKQQVEKVHEKVNSNAIESNQDLVKNNELIQTIEHNITTKNTNDSRENHKEAIGVKENVVAVVKKSSDNESFKLNEQVANNETIKTKAQQLAVSGDNKSLENALKNNETKVLVENADKKEAANQEIATLNHKDKVNSVKDLSNATNSAQSSNSQSDDQERLNTQRDMELKKEERRQQELTEAQRSKDKVEQLKEQEKTNNAAVSGLQVEKHQSLLDAKNEIDKVEVKQVQATNVPNALGEKYPEGVSQEIFQRKDEAGILSAIITRRIVVVGGRGNEYVRTQTSYATTFSKNGKPITEYNWQKETQDAKLQRHY